MVECLPSPDRYQKTGVSIRWVQGSALSLPFDDSCFDLVLCQLRLSSFRTGRSRFAK
ncbi:MAG: class I SAM-dependent methyltransferase [Xanthobacteraceae bacterium]